MQLFGAHDGSKVLYLVERCTSIIAMNANFDGATVEQWAIKVADEKTDDVHELFHSLGFVRMHRSCFVDATGSVVIATFSVFFALDESVCKQIEVPRDKMRRQKRTAFEARHKNLLGDEPRKLDVLSVRRDLLAKKRIWFSEIDA